MRVMATSWCLRLSRAPLPLMICSEPRSCQLPEPVAIIAGTLRLTGRRSKPEAGEQRSDPDQRGEQNSEEHRSRAEILGHPDGCVQLGLDVIAQPLDGGVEKLDRQKKQ